MEEDIAKHLPKLDDYELEWVRNSLNVKAVEINRWKSLVVELLDRVIAAEKSLHVAMLNRQQDAIKLGELSVDVKEHERRLDKASEYLKTLKTREETK